MSPLTRKGKEIFSSFKQRYGDAKGSSYFYATIQKNPLRTKGWHKSKR